MAFTAGGRNTESDMRVRRDLDGEVCLSAAGGVSRGIMVELVKQVHLQKDVGAGKTKTISTGGEAVVYGAPRA